MISFNLAMEIFIQIEKSKLIQLREVLYESAFRYHECRFGWKFKTLGESHDVEGERSIAHDAFINNCDIMARNMKDMGEPYLWRTKLTNDRKVIGDLASILVAIIGKNR
jgi:hypothetical protein